MKRTGSLVSRADQIGIVVHPESVVHSMIELVDGSVIAQMGVTDMRHAIQYALTYPERHACELPPLDLTALQRSILNLRISIGFLYCACLSRVARRRHAAGRDECSQ